MKKQNSNQNQKINKTNNLFKLANKVKITVIGVKITRTYLRINSSNNNKMKNRRQTKMFNKCFL